MFSYFKSITKIVTQTEHVLYVAFSQSDWFIAQNERFWLAIIARNSYHKNSESSEVTAKLNIYSRKYNFNCSVTANIQAELWSFCGKTCILEFVMVQPRKKPFGKAKALEIKKKGIVLHTDTSTVVWTLI